jgi:rare lipoprotein A (peptidoglycan hydrolase)
LGVKPTAKSPGCSIRVTINDRSPYVRGRNIDLTLAAADALRVHGLGMVRGQEVDRFDGGADDF